MCFAPPPEPPWFYKTVMVTTDENDHREYNPDCRGQRIQCRYGKAKASTGLRSTSNSTDCSKNGQDIVQFEKELKEMRAPSSMLSSAFR